MISDIPSSLKSLCRSAKSLVEGAHETWLFAIISAIYKKGKRTDSCNYRPVSLTSVISKIMESLVRDAIMGDFNVDKQTLL